MKFKSLLISLTLGLGLALALLWLPTLSQAYLEQSQEIERSDVWRASTAASPAATTRYVDDAAGSDDSDCSQPISPCQTIQYAIDQADAGDEIRVAAGDYGDTVVRPATDGYDGPSVITQVVYISETLTIRGGYSTGDWNTSDPAGNPTTLDAEGGKRVIFAGGNITITLENLHIANGDASGLGGGAWGGDDAGGGVYIVTATAILNHCEIVNNTAQAGGGLFLDGSAATLDGNTIISNSAACDAGGNYGDGGGLFLARSPATLVGNRIVSNRAEYSGSGLYLGFGSDAALVNNVVADNEIAGPFSFGCGLYVSGSSPRLLHSTIARNTGGNGAGVCAASDPSPSTLAMTNTILVSHTVGIDVQAGNAATLEATLWGNVTDTLSAGDIATGTINVWGDPDFADPSVSDYHIGDNSAALNAGVDAGVATDIDGQIRDSQPDIGADEGYACIALNNVDIDGPTTGALGGLHTFTAIVIPPTAALPITYTWQATGQSDIVTTVYELSHTVSFAWSAGATGTKNITVTAANCGSAVSRTHTITLELASIYLPLVTRNWPPMAWHSTCVDCPPIIDDITQGSIAIDSAGNPHVAYGGVKLYHAWRDETGWQVEVADPTFQVGSWAAIALDDDDHPHISYFNYDTWDLKYAHWDGSAWISETVDVEGGWDSYIALDSNDRPHIAYRDAQGFSGTALKHAHWNGSVWQIDTVKDLASSISSRNTTLALDGDDQPHISYSLSDSGDDPDYLYHAYLDGGDWTTETVATANYIGDNAIALDSAGNPRIIYYAIDGETGQLGYTWWDGGQWQNDTLITSDDSIAALSLALDGSNVPHASYYLNTDTSMHYAYLDGTWQFETVESGLRLEMGEIASLALDGAGQPHLLYLLDNTILQHAYQEGEVWQTEPVAEGGDPGRYSSIILDQAEHPHVIYTDQGRMQLRYAAWGGSAWQTRAVDQGDWDYAFDYAGLALDGDGHPHVAYNKGSVFWGNELHYARWDGAAWQIQTLPSKDVGSASNAAALVLDSAGRPHIVHGVWSGIAHTYWDGAAWQSETVDAQAKSSFSKFSLTIDGADKLHLAYWDVTNEVLKYAYEDGAGWHVESVDDEGQSPSIALDSAGRPHISYCRIPGIYCEELRYARWDGTQWQISILEDGGRTGFHTSLAFDSADRPRISYYNLDEGAVKYARWDGTKWQIETVSNGSYPTLVLDSAGRPHISYYAAGGLQYTWWGEEVTRR
jgi:hypothetical protein